MKGCIIVPYRDRAEHLAHFVPHYRDVLPIYVIEQADDKPFNRAKLLNIGFLEAGCKYDYAVYHDVDMLAEEGADYSYPDVPTHLATMCSQFDYMMPFDDYFGGVIAVNTIDMVHSNGFSNNFWSWSAEDCEFREHLLKNGYAIKRRQTVYKCFDHPRPIDPINYPKNQQLYKQGRASGDGLSSCVYDLISIEQKDGYALIKAAL